MFRENVGDVRKREREREYCIVLLIYTRLIFARGNLSRVKQVLFMKLSNKCVRRPITKVGTERMERDCLS